MRGKESLRIGTMNHSVPIRRGRVVELGEERYFYAGNKVYTLAARRISRMNGLSTDYIDVEERKTFSSHGRSLRIAKDGGRITGPTRVPGLFHLFSRED